MAEAVVELANVRIVEGERSAQLVLHCELADAPAVAALAGIALPTTMLRLEITGDWRALHLAPDEWLLIGPSEGRDAITERIASATQPNSLVDVGERSRHVRIDGQGAAALLNTGCPLDLAAQVFTVGSCTRTLFGKAPVLLERETDCFRMHYGRSFHQYVVGLVRSAALDLPETRSH